MILFPGSKTLNLEAGLLTYIFISPSHQKMTVATERNENPKRDKHTVAGTVLDLHQIPYYFQINGKPSL